MIHPRIAELVEVASAYAPCALSSNLNLSKVDYEQLLSKNPKQFFISLSGFTQQTYAKSHRGGNIDTVKKNMFLLSLAKAKTRSSTQIIVRYHRYLDNLEEEPKMRQYSTALGFIFEPTWARLLPAEKNIQHHDNPAHLSQQDLDLIQRLALPPSKTVLESLKGIEHKNCPLRENMMAINNRGEVQLCCFVFDESRFGVANYLEASLEEIQDQKRQMTICEVCMHSGIINFCTLTHEAERDLISRMHLHDPAKATVD